MLPRASFKMRGVQRLSVVLSVLLVPAAALARGEVAVVSYEEGAATGGEAYAAGEAAIGIANDHSAGRTIIRLEGVSDQAKACTDPVCVAQLGSLRGAEFVLVVAVGRPRAQDQLTTRFRLVLVRDPIEQSMEVARAECDVGMAPQDWRPLMEPTLGPILDPIEPAPIATGSLLVTANVSEAEVFVDGNFVGRTPMPVVPDVPVGRHDVALRRDRYEEFSTSVEILEGQESRVDVTMERIGGEEDSGPFYTKPVTWIVAGGVVVAGSLAAIFLLGGEEKNPHPNAVVVPPLR